MRANALAVTVRFNFLGESTPAEFYRASQELQSRYRIYVKTYETYRYINMHTVCAPATITYRRNSIMRYVYHKGIFKRTYYLDVVVNPDGSLVFQRF